MAASTKYCFTLVYSCGGGSGIRKALASSNTKHKSKIQCILFF